MKLRQTMTMLIVTFLLLMGLGKQALAGNETVAGLVDVTPGNEALVITASYTGDDDNNNSLQVEWGIYGVDFSRGIEILPHVPSPYAYTIAALDLRKTYQIRVTFLDENDPDPASVVTDLSPNNPLTHNSISTGSDKWEAFGGWGVKDGKYGKFVCNTCHIRRSSNIKRVRVTLAAPDDTTPFPIETDGLTVVFTDTRDGSADFGDDTGGHQTSQQICEGCHSITAYHRYDTTTQTELDHYNESDCVGCHQHRNGFGHKGGGGTGCDACHGVDGGAGTTISHSTHTENDSDDLKGPHLTCDTCHDAGNFPYFKSGTDTNGDGKFSLAETNVCDACHSPLGSYDGVNDIIIGAKSNWTNGVYSGNDLLTGKEKWCVGCHDESPSVVDGVAAPNVTGDEDGSYTYGVGYGYYKTGHGLPTANTYASSGGRVYGAGVECNNCHDYSFTHTDGNPRTYSAASNNYQSGFRLKSIDGQKPMNIPHPQNIEDHDPGQYRLCLSCHDTNKYLMKTPDPVLTSFRDDQDLGPWDGGTAPINIHEYHLAFNSLDYDSDWDGTNDSEIACVNCHNVHGSTQLSMIRDGKLVDREPGMQIYYDNVLAAPATSSATVPNPATTLNISTGTIFYGPSPGNVCGHCHGGQWVKYYRTPPSAPEAPALDWTGETNFTSDGVHPGSGLGGNFFTFRIKYTDANSQPPRLIQVWVDEDDSGSYESSEKYDLLEVDTNDTDVSNGKLYRVILAINDAGDSTLAYRFYAWDGKFDATDGAAVGNPIDDTANTITLSNNAPVLSWSDESGFVADGINPNTATTGSTFTFRVNYSDADNNAPSAIQVWVDRDDDGSPTGDESSELISMDEVDGGDTTYTNGKLYTKDITIAAAGDNTLLYRFIATDGPNSASGTPSVNQNLTVTTSNNAPVLTWTGETSYIRDGVNPDAGVPGATFTFRVTYLDADNNPPGSIQLWLDKNDDGDYLDAGEQLDITAAGSDNDYTDGRSYASDVILNTAGDGIFNYRFQASDGTVPATGDPTENNMVSVLIDTKKVSCPGLGDFDYTSIQTAIDSATDGDTILVADGTCTETLVIDNKDLTIVSVNGAGATIIDGNGASTVVTLQNGADTTLDGFTVTGGNHPDGYGAGISISASSPTIANSIITANSGQRATAIYATGNGSLITISDSTVSSNTSSQEGPGIYLVSGVSAVISNTTVSNNSTTNGSGGGLYLSTASSASLTILDSTFSGNSVPSLGGGLFASGSSGTVNIDIRGTTFNNTNHAQKGGAMYISDGGATMSLSITDSTFSDNTTSLEGSALYLTALDSVAISSSTVSSNTSSNGAAMHMIGIGNLTVTDSFISDNTSAGAIGGGMLISGTTATFERTMISGNANSQRGGGGYVYTATPTFRNCIVSGNKATSFEGGGLLFDGLGVSATIINSTFSGNKAGTTGGAIGIRNGALVTVKNSILYGDGGVGGSSEVSSTVSASFSDIDQVGYEGSTNLSIKPFFVNPMSYDSAPTSSGDYHLMAYSPAIDMGTATDAPGDDFDGNLRPLGSGVDMGADEVVTVVNNAPNLIWAGGTDYLADGVEPNMGAGGGSYEFRVNYTDADDEAPAFIQVWIDTNDDGDFLDGGEKINMTPVDGGDADYTDGRLYTRAETLAYAGDGVLLYRFYAADSTTAATGAPSSSRNVVINNPPALYWLGSGNYAADGVDPDSSSSGTSFDFRVRYSDIDNDAPTAIQLWVDTNDDGDYLDSGEKLTMTQVDSGDSVYSDGKDYKKSINLNYAGNGAFNYRFYASDGSLATGTPVSTGGTVTVTNTVPSLYWLGSGNYMNDGVSPNGAISGTNSFEFRIIYTDADNQEPTSIQIWLDLNDDNSYQSGEKFAMTPVDGDSDYTDGRIYTYTGTNLTRGSDDYLNYRFAASDGIADAIGTPVTTDKQVGVFTANQAPELDWAGEPGYTTDGVNPDSGMAGDTFTFQVEYTDPENIAPSSIHVWIDTNDNTTEDSGELTALPELNAGDIASDDGKLYGATIVISSVTNPTTNYKFKASDGSNAATGNATANKTISVISPITVCPAGSPTCDYNTISNAIAAASSGDYILVKDGTYDEKIDFSGKQVTVMSENGANVTTLRNGGTGWAFNNPVVNFTNGETAGTVLDGFTITNQNSGWSSTRGIYIAGATPTIKNCIIENNAPSGGTNGGGGVYIDNAVPTFKNCTIRANSHANRHGCGMYITGSASGATIINSTIGGALSADGNRCTNGSGGGIYYTGATTGSLAISDSNIQFNQGAANGGGLYLGSVTKPTEISNSTILDNYTGSGGNGGGIMASSAPVRITNGSLISGNEAGANRSGGGIYSTGSTLTVNDSTVSSNTAGVGNSGWGGGVYFTGTTLNMSKAIIIGNTSTSDGGGLYTNASSEATIINSLIAGNIIASNDYKYGGGIANLGTLNLYFSTISDNYVIRRGGGLYAAGTENVVNSIVYGNNSGNGNPEIEGTVESLTLTETGGGVSFASPQPATNGNPTTSGDYHLQSDSNCIDTGDATNAAPDDIEGNTRPADILGEGDGIDDYDKGAYEYIP